MHAKIGDNHAYKAHSKQNLKAQPKKALAYIQHIYIKENRMIKTFVFILNFIKWILKLKYFLYHNYNFIHFYATSNNIK